MPKGKGYGRKKGRGTRKGKNTNRQTVRATRNKGKKIYYVGGYQA